jgi:hypothetical protein
LTYTQNEFYMENGTNVVSVEIATIKKVQSLVPEWSKSTAQRRIDLARDALGKSWPKILTMQEFKSYFGF